MLRDYVTHATTDRRLVALRRALGACLDEMADAGARGITGGIRELLGDIGDSPRGGGGGGGGGKGKRKGKGGEGGGGEGGRTAYIRTVTYKTGSEACPYVAILPALLDSV